MTLMQTMLHKYEEMQMRLKSQDVAALPSPAVQVRLPVAVLPPPTSQVLKRLMEEDCGTGTVTTFFFYKNLNNSLSKKQ